MQDEATIIFCDNYSTIAIAKNSIFHDKTKHINIRYHFIREVEKKNEVNSLLLIIVNILTKACNKFVKEDY